MHLFGVNLGDLKYLFFGLALVLLMIFRPQGLFPVRQQLLAYGKRARDLLGRRQSQRPRHDGTEDVESAALPVIDEDMALHREVHAAEGEILLETTDLTVKFGGLTALDSGELQHQARRDPRPDQAQRCRQDHLLQRDHGRVPAQRRDRSPSTASGWAASNAIRSPASASLARSRTSGSGAR